MNIIKRTLATAGLAALLLGSTVMSSDGQIKNKSNQSKLIDKQNYDYTADFLGNNDRIVSKSEQTNLDFLTNKARSRNTKNVYVGFIIHSYGKRELINSEYTDNNLPSITFAESLKGTKLILNNFYSNEELTVNENSKSWQKEDFYNHYGLYEIDRTGKLLGTYLLTKDGLKKQ